MKSWMTQPESLVMEFHHGGVIKQGLEVQVLIGKARIGTGSNLRPEPECLKLWYLTIDVEQVLLVGSRVLILQELDNLVAPKFVFIGANKIANGQLKYGFVTVDHTFCMSYLIPPFVLWDTVQNEIQRTPYWEEILKYICKRIGIQNFCGCKTLLSKRISFYQNRRCLPEEKKNEWS